MAILFDLDDTILDHAEAFQKGTQALHARFATSLTLTEFAAAWEASLKIQYERYLAGAISYEQQRLERVRDVLDPSLSDSEAMGWFSVYRDAYESAWRIFPDAASALEALSSRPLGIITNGQVDQQRKKLRVLGIAERFSCVVISESVGHAKPSPTIFRHACELLGEAPDRCAYVGDRYDLDAQGARDSGLVGIWLDRQGTATAAHVGPIIRSLEQLTSPAFAETYLPG